MRWLLHPVADIKARSAKHPRKCSRFRLALLRLLAICGPVIGVTGACADGPGGPLLVVTQATNGFSRYYSEILLAEGLNEFALTNLAAVSSDSLTNYDVVILGEMSLSPAQVTTFSNWVNDGGKLIAMRPDKQLAGLLGLVDAGGTLSESYLQVNTTNGPGVGIVGETMQFHGTADRYTLGSATLVATLYTNATVATTNPAVTLRNVGVNGGQAAAFTYDLARSVVWTRQGNPAWEGQDRDGIAPLRSDDLFYGNAAGDPQPDWVDLDKVAIPQADEQQRLLANLIIQMNANRKLLPRFWYFPDDHQAVVVMTGDDHANNGTAARFDQYLALSGTNTLVDDWKTVRGTSYIFPNTLNANPPLTDAQAAAYEAAGFEIALHCNTGCNSYTVAALDAYLSSQLQDLAINYPSLPTPQTLRPHCIAWSGYTILPEVSWQYGIRLDTSYYFYPPNWVSNRPGMFTGSGMPMRFATTNGNSIDVYQAATQMTDESDQVYPFTANALLDRAFGAEGYYGFFVANMHTDANSSSTPGKVGSDAIIGAALSRGVPVITARQLLKWVDGRNNSSLVTLNSTTNQETISVQVGSGARGLQVMMPVRVGYNVGSIVHGGNAQPFRLREVKGLWYAVFGAENGNFEVNFVPDTNGPVVVETSPAAGAEGVKVDTSVRVVFSEPMDETTFPSNIVLSNAVSGVVASTVLYDSATSAAVLTPVSPLALSTEYTVVVAGGTGGVKDLAGNALTNDLTASFTTTNQIFYSLWEEFDGTADSGDANSLELGLKFQSGVDGYIAGVRFHKSAANNGPHTGTLWSSNGTALSSVTFSNETGTGWQYQALTNPVAITSNTTYVASYFAPVGHYSFTSGAFVSGVTNYPLRALSSGEAGGNGVYRLGAGFPTATFNADNYWVDVVFVETLPPDTNGPVVVAVSPTNGAVGVSRNASVRVTFSEAMDAATLTNGIALSNTVSGVVASTVTYYGSTNTAVLTPSGSLALETVHTLLVVGGVGGVKDAAGNALTNDFTASFTTMGSAQSIWDDSATPDTVSDPEGSAVELGLKFRSAINGYVTGIRFYKGASNIGTHIGNLWTGNGDLLASNTFSNETTSGWQHQALADPVAIDSNTTYVVSYHAPGGRYSKSDAYFATAGVTNFPLWALANGEDGPNGVYGYGPSIFPTQTFNATHYWVDVVFAETLESVTNYPTATNMTVEFPEDEVEVVTLQGGGGQVTYAILTAPTNGVLGVLDPNSGVVSYAPNSNYHGVDMFQYTVHAYDQQATGTVSLTITPVNDAPFATNMAVALPENTFTNLTLLGSDVEGVITFGIVTGPTNGVLSNFDPGAGMVVYSPATNHVGSDAFTFAVSDGSLSATGLVTLTVTLVNVPPSAIDDSYEAGGLAFLEVAAPGVLNNDSDSDGDGLVALLVSGPLQGVLSLNSNGGFNYAPTNHFSGVDTFTYQASDGLATSGLAVVNLVVSNRIKITSLVLSNQVAIASWTSIVGKDYRLQFKAGLAETNWTDLSPVITATGLVTSGTNAISATPNGFYRILCIGD